MRGLMLAITAAGALALSTPSVSAQDALGGALVGAGVGAAIGGAAGGGRGAAIGAGVGAGVGAAAGANAGYHRPAYGYYDGPAYGYYQSGATRRCWINRFGERVCKVRRYY